MEQTVDEPALPPTEPAQYGEVRVKKEDIIEGMRTLPEVFIDFFLHDIMTCPVPEFHRRVWSLMTNIAQRYIAVALPRNHAKTTLAKLAVVWYLLFSDFRFIVYVSNTSDVAVKAVVDISEFLRSSNFTRVFGAPIWLKELAGDGEYHFLLRLPGGKEKKCILKARGANQQVRGLNIDNQRPQLAVVDDLEDADNTESAVLQAKLIKWFYGTFFKALDKAQHKIIYIGNMVNPNCLLKKICDSPRWTSMRLGALLADGKPLWPDMWSLPELIEDYREYCRLGLSSLWYAEMMNLITAGENALIQIDEIGYAANLDQAIIRGGFITIDPATGTGGDDTAVVVHLLVGMDEFNIVTQVVDYRFGQLDELATVNAALELAFTWGVNIISVESTAYQRALATLFEVILASRGLLDFTILRGMPTSSKLVRIRAWCALLKEKAYLLSIGEIHMTKQLLDFDVTKKNNTDDLIDSAAQGPEVLNQYLPLILSRKVSGLINAKIVHEHEMC